MNPKQNKTKQNKIALLQRNKSVKAERRSRLRNGNFQEAVVFSFACWDTPVFLVALNELHTYFILSELHQELIRNLDIELLFGLAEGRPVQLGGHFNQVIAAEEKVSFTSGLRALFEVDGKEAIVLGAHGHFGHIHQGNLGLDLPRLLIGKKEVVTC